MSENDKKIPKLRFTGYTDAWEQRKLVDNVEEVLDYRGKSPTKFGMEWGDEGYLVLSALNVKDGYIDKSVEAKYGNQELFERWMGDRRLMKGDVLFTTEAPLGNVAQVPDNDGYILNQRAVAFKTDSNKTDNNFLAQLLRSPSVQARLNANASGGTAKGIGMKEFGKLTAYVPTQVEEERKIGAFLTNLDHLIALHQRKLSDVQNLKAGLIQKMFPKNGADVPEIRFPGFTHAWEQRKLGDEAEILAGGDVDKTKLKESGEYPVIANALTNNGIVGYYDEEYRIEAPAVTVTGRGDVGHAQARKTNFTPVVRLLSVKSKHDVDFLENAINNHRVLVESTGVPQLTSPQLENYKIYFPSLEEEVKIGEFFSSLDHLITLHQRKLEHLQEQKKSLLQQMFV